MMFLREKIIYIIRIHQIDDSPWDSSDDEDEEAEKKPSINTVMTTIPQKKVRLSRFAAVDLWFKRDHFMSFSC